MMCMWQRWRSNAAMARKNPVVWKCEASFVAGDLKPKRQKRVIVDDDLDAAISRLFPVLGLLELVADCLMTFLRRLESTNFGPVQDVSIPYQQKRMFGFVTFDFPETVKLILAKGNPHFVCDARVLVKPYKEKGKIPDKHRKQQQMERGDFTGCGSPTGLESRDPFDLGARMFYNTRDMLWNRKLEEQADLQQSIELQNRRLMGLQLLDVKRNSHHHRTLSRRCFASSNTFPNFLRWSERPRRRQNRFLKMALMNLQKAAL